ncbi:MAG: hypothetical protein WCD12_11165 [Candidatus Binatus sp.]|jgi:hypothetical protein|uniref:hypothetical protein n=1 Tax=Candidatus Binatus sp. TaxID=2811406 RepID=UPI003C728819
MASDDQPGAGESITLDTLQRDVLVPQIQAFLDATNDPQARETYLSLKSAVESLEIPSVLQLRLGAIVEVALTSGRVRRLFGPAAELSLNALFLKTPRGREVAQSLAELNKALATLKGQTVEQITSSQRSPGAYSLTLKTSNCQIVIRFEQGGVRVESLEVDLDR